MRFGSRADVDEIVVDGYNEAHAFTEMVLGFEPGPSTMALLSSIDIAALDSYERVCVLKAWERQQAWLMGQIQHATVGVAGLEASSEDDWVREEVACGLGLAPDSVGQRIWVARTLVGKLPATMAALEFGEISWRHAYATAEFCGNLDAETAAFIEQRVLKRAGDQGLSQFKRSLRRAVLTAAPEQARERRAKAASERSVQLVPDSDGMATLCAHLPELDALAVFDAIDTAARKAAGAADADGVKLGIDARRADAFVALITGADPERLARAKSDKVEIQIVADLPTVLGLADNPAELVGYGPIPGDVARELARDAKWRRLLTDPLTGQLLDFGRRTYRPPKLLRDFLRTRDRTCRFPFCGRLAQRCDIDHAHAWDDGGPTTTANCGCLCRRHHRLKTAGLWELLSHADGSATWTSPSGHRYQVRPPPVLGDE